MNPAKVLGYYVMQLYDYGKHRVVEAGSRMLTPAKQNFGMTSLELMGLYWAMKNCKHYLRGLSYFEVMDEKQA